MLAAAFPNATYLGLPLLENTFGPWARSIAIQFDMFACFPLVLTVGIIIANRFGNKPETVHPLLSLFSVVPLWAVAIAVTLNLFQVGSPVWVRLEVADPPTVLRELPSHRPSDTWFGGNTRVGELCYATETRALLHLENLPVLSRSAVTPVRIRNLAPSPLALERLKLPVPLLALYSDRRGRLWTQGVTLTRTEESDMATLDVRPGPPSEIEDSTLMSPARNHQESTLWTRAFSGLLGLARVEEEPT